MIMITTCSSTAVLICLLLRCLSLVVVADDGGDVGENDDGAMKRIHTQTDVFFFGVGLQLPLLLLLCQLLSHWHICRAHTLPSTLSCIWRH